MKQIGEEKKKRALERRQQLSALSRELKAVAELTGEAENVNELQRQRPKENTQLRKRIISLFATYLT